MGCSLGSSFPRLVRFISQFCESSWFRSPRFVHQSFSLRNQDRQSASLRGIGLSDEAVVFSLATLAVIELRGAIPVGYLLQLKPVTLTVFSVLGSVLVSLTPSDVEGKKFWSPFLNLVGQIAEENLALDKSDDAAGLHGVRSASHSSSSSSSLSSKVDDSFHVDDINGGFEEPEVDWRPTQSGRKRGRPSKGDVSSMGASNVQVIKKIMDMDEAASFSSPIEPVPVGFVSFSCFISALQE
ncbi:hypothetical protein LINPERPRIM_LOCUS29707 [Linum perenne]